MPCQLQLPVPSASVMHVPLVITGSSTPTTPSPLTSLWTLNTPPGSGFSAPSCSSSVKFDGSLPGAPLQSLPSARLPIRHLMAYVDDASTPANWRICRPAPLLG